MIYADKITKQFHNYGNPVDPTVPDLINDYQDPTYVGFQIQLVEIPTRSTSNLFDMDDLPHGLFSQDPVKDIYSTYNYFISRGEYRRANYILLFEKHFKQLINDCPWYFVKVSGLADSWKMDPTQNWRGKDKKLTIETLESIDLKMSYIIDLYRKAVWDANWMRWAVPDHMRYFKMNIVVSEVRPMKFAPRMSQTTNSPGQEKNAPQSKFGKAKQAIVDGINDRIDTLKASIGLSNANQREAYGLYDPSTPWSTATFFKFCYEQCEIDIFTEAPPFLETVGISPETMATNKLIINTNVIRERNVYGLLGAILEDTATYKDYGKEASDKSFYYPSPVSTSTDFIPTGISNEASAKLDYSAGLTQRDQTQKQFNSDNGIPGSGGFLSQLGQRALTGLQAAATDFVKNKVNSFLLGNVYGTSPLGLIGSAQDILNNPAGAIENLLRKHSSPTIGSDIARRVQLTGAEIELVQNIIGQGNLQGIIPSPANLGAVTFESNATVGAPLGNANLNTVPTSPATAGRAGAIPDRSGDITTDSSNIGNANLNAANVNRQGPQRTNLAAFAQAGSNPGKVDLEAPIITKATLGKADL